MVDRLEGRPRAPTRIFAMLFSGCEAVGDIDPFSDLKKELFSAKLEAGFSDPIRDLK